MGLSLVGYGLGLSLLGTCLGLGFDSTSLILSLVGTCLGLLSGSRYWSGSQSCGIYVSGLMVLVWVSVLIVMV